MTPEDPTRAKPGWPQHAARRLRHLDPTVKGLMWSAASGFVFCGLNAFMRSLTLQLDPFRRDALSKPVRFLDKYKDYV
jgi:hypothetical protein